MFPYLTPVTGNFAWAANRCKVTCFCVCVRSECFVPYFFAVTSLYWTALLFVFGGLGLKDGDGGTGWSSLREKHPFVGQSWLAYRIPPVSTCCIPLQCEQLFSSFASLSVPCLLISESQPPRPQPCDLCVYNVFPFRFARASSSRAKYITLHQGLPSGVSLKPLGSTCCSQINGKECIAPAADLFLSMPHRPVFSAGEVCRCSALWLIVPIMKSAQLQCMMPVKRRTCFTLRQT